MKSTIDVKVKVFGKNLGPPYFIGQYFKYDPNDPNCKFNDLSFIERFSLAISQSSSNKNVVRVLGQFYSLGRVIELAKETIDFKIVQYFGQTSIAVGPCIRLYKIDSPNPLMLPGLDVPKGTRVLGTKVLIEATEYKLKPEDMIILQRARLKISNSVQRII